MWLWGKFLLLNKYKGIDSTDLEDITSQSNVFNISSACDKKLFCKDSIVEKNRYLITNKSTVWEVDEFLGNNKGLVVAEVELKSEDQQYDSPDWIGKEISTDKKYYNYHLAHYPYKSWDTIE